MLVFTVMQSKITIKTDCLRNLPELLHCFVLLFYYYYYYYFVGVWVSCLVSYFYFASSLLSFVAR